MTQATRPAEVAAEDAEPEDVPAAPSLGAQALQLFGLCGFALAQPLLGVLGSGPSFFIAHDAQRVDIIAFTAIVLVLPPLALLGVVRLLQAVRPPAGRPAMAVAFGMLVALTVVPAIDRAAPLPVPAFVAILLAVAVATGLAYARVQPIRLFATFLGPAALLFGASFLFFSPVSSLLLSGDALVSAADVRAPTDAYVLVLDELPLGALLAADGEVDEARYPGFARLAATSTWYPEATTVSPATVFAVPALLTGRNPGEAGTAWPPEKWDVPPVTSTYPRSLFAMLETSHAMDVREWVTRLCARDVCGATRSRSAPSLAADVGVIVQHLVLPVRVAEAHLPPLDGRWAGFDRAHGAGGGDQPDELEELEGVDIDTGDHLEAALARLRAGGREGAGAGHRLWFVHERRPHRPPDHLPDGTRYRRHAPFLWEANEDAAAGASVRQQYTLQLQYVDRLIGELLDRLAEEGALDDALVVVTSDHGVTFTVDGDHRAADSLDPDALSDVLPIPLFVKYPGQTAGEVDDRAAQLVDVLPTVVEVMDVDLRADWQFDGSSLLDPEPEGRRLFWQPEGWLDPDQIDLDPVRMADQAADLFGQRPGAHDVYAMGPFGDLVGEEAAPLVGEPARRGHIWPYDPAAYADVDPSSGVVPALFDAEVHDLRGDRWIAVAVEGVVAGLAPVSFDPYHDEASRVEVMLDPDLLVEGANRLDVYLVDDGVLRPLPVG